MTDGLEVTLADGLRRRELDVIWRSAIPRRPRRGRWRAITLTPYRLSQVEACYATFDDQVMELALANPMPRRR